MTAGRVSAAPAVTVRNSSRHAPRLTIDALRWTIGLAIGEPPGGGERSGGVASKPADWEAVRIVAGIERCLGAAWLRSGAFIRRTAPRAVAQRWRAEVAVLDEASRRQLAELARVVRLLEQGGVSLVVLKGAPLSARLYGDPFVRHSADIDLFVPPGERACAHALLIAGGWWHDGGGAPGEALYWRAASQIRTLLELHSELADDELLRFVRLGTPARREMTIDGHRLPAFDGALLPAYLATHLAKHTSAPILWLVDFHTLWGKLDERARVAAREAARAAGAGRHLEWCVARAASLSAAAGGDLRALRQCGGASGIVREPHAVLRNARLGASPRQAMALVAGWIARRMRNVGRSPVEQRGRLAWMERIAARARAPATWTPHATGATSPLRTPDATGTGSPLRLLRLGAEASLAIVRQCIAAGGATWMVARGSSMWPAIPSGARVRIAPVDRHGPRIGDVVLADAGGFEPVLHRVVGVTAGAVLLRGDNMPRADQPLPLDRVIGVATHVSIDAEQPLAIPITGGRWRPLARHWWHRARRAASARFDKGGERA